MTRSKKSGKQRKAAFNAPIHIQRKRLRARLLTDDTTFVGIRSVTVRVGDTIEILRGDYSHPNSVKTDTRGKRQGQKRGRSGASGVVIRINSKKGWVFVEGLTLTKADGKDEAVAIHASNIVVTKLDEGDPVRLANLAARAGGA